MMRLNTLHTPGAFTSVFGWPHWLMWITCRVLDFACRWNSGSADAFFFPACFEGIVVIRGLLVVKVKVMLARSIHWGHARSRIASASRGGEVDASVALHLGEQPPVATEHVTRWATEPVWALWRKEKCLAWSWNWITIRQSFDEM
jgi:hypothetical protein